MFRFFTVYGPWGRPDMALFKFVDAILDGRPIDIYNHGEMYRDFTYVDDLVRAIRLLIDAVPERPASRGGDRRRATASRPVAPFRVVNIGNSDKVRLLDFIDAIEAELGMKAMRNYMDDADGRRARDLGRCEPAAAADRLPPADRLPRRASRSSWHGSATITASDHEVNAMMHDLNDQDRRHRPRLCRAAAGGGVRQAVDRSSASTSTQAADRRAARRDGTTRARSTPRNWPRREQLCLHRPILRASPSATIYIVTVPTPIDAHKRPDLTPLI